MEMKNWPERKALASRFFVELPGIETDAPPGNMDSEQQFRSASFPFSPARYQRFRFRVLTASRPSGPTFLPLLPRSGRASRRSVR
jgi:hypothetical protein